MEYEEIPNDMMQSMEDYVEKGSLMGDFLTAMFSCELQSSVFFATEDEMKIFKKYAEWIRWESPPECWGSYKIVEKWIYNKEKEKK